MADARYHEHFVYQDIDLKNNKIDNVSSISAGDGLSITAGTAVTINTETEFKKPTTFDGNIHVVKQPASGGTYTYPESHFDGNVLIGESTTDRTKTLTVAGVKIHWDDTSKSLIFTKLETT